MSRKPRLPLLKFDNGVVIGVNDSVYLTYMGQDRRPYRLRAFVAADKTRLCLQLDAVTEVPLPEENTPLRVTWPITESHDGYTFSSRLIGLTDPDPTTRLISLIVQTPRPEDVRKMDNRRGEIRISARWPTTVSWESGDDILVIDGVIHNISFTGCSVYIPTRTIEQLATAEAVLSFFLSDRYSLSMRPLHQLIGATERDDPEIIFKPFIDIEALIRGRTKTIHEGEEVEVISFQLVHERRPLNILITAMQVQKRRLG